MSIDQLLKKYIKQGYQAPIARNLAAQEIILTKIAHSKMARFLTLKGGIVMYSLSGNQRRATRDIDFDFIRYSISKLSIYRFIDALNEVEDGYCISVSKDPEPLHQEDYRGVRLTVSIVDSTSAALSLKLDIGVHKRLDVDQGKLVFFSESGEGISLLANTPEQIFAEKTISLARLGAASTRFKDVYDIYYLIQLGLETERVKAILFPMILDSKRHPDSLREYKANIISALRNPLFIEGCSDVKNKWIDIDYESASSLIEAFIQRL